MDRKNYQAYYEVLELPTDASMADVRKAYTFLRDLYSKESIVTVPLEGELPEERQEEIKREIEEAYQKLVELFHSDRRAPERDFRHVKLQFSSFSGDVLRQIRERLNIDLQDMALATNIQAQYLENIENENYGALPVYVYTRGYVTNYAKYLSLDPQRVVEDYMTRYTAWKNGA